MGPAEVKYLAARLGEIRPQEPVLELGAGWDAEFHRTPFRAVGYTNFLTQDIAEYEGTTPDYLGDICAGTNIPDEIAGCCLAFNLLEHTYAPWAAVDEVLRVLKPEGVFFGSVPLRVHIHRWDRDYWRFCPDGIAYLLRHFRMVHFAVDGNVSLPANLLWAAVKDPEETEWWDHNEEVVSRPEVIVGNDYLTPSPLKRRVLDFMRAHFRLTLDRWDEPMNPERMRELGFVDWTVVDYRDARAYTYEAEIPASITFNRDDDEMSSERRGQIA